MCDTNIIDAGVLSSVDEALTLLLNVVENFSWARVEVSAATGYWLVPGARYESIGVVCSWYRVGDPIRAKQFTLARFSTFRNPTSAYVNKIIRSVYE